jgi:hypothetical protein
VIVGIALQSSVDMTFMLAPPLIGHNLPQVSDAHIARPVLDVEVEMVDVIPVTSHPVVVTVVNGEHR